MQYAKGLRPANAACLSIRLSGFPGLALSALALVMGMVAKTATAADARQAADNTGAAAAADTDKDAIHLPSVQVTEKRAGNYVVEHISSGTKTDTPLRDVPQSVTVITDELIRDQAMQGIADVVRYVPGVGASQGENNRDAVILRGTASTADFYVNGVRDDAQYFRDLYNIDRVEVLKGPNAMIFGRGGGGGVINRVTKQAGWTPVREVSVQSGSYSDRSIAADVGQALNGAVAGRVLGAYEYSNGFRDGFHLERYGLNPTVALRAGDSTRVVLGYELFHDERTADRGIPSLNGQPYPIDRSTFFGNPDLSVAKADVNAFTALVEHDFGPGLTLRNNTRYGDYDRMYQNFVPGAVNAGAGTVPITAYSATAKRDNIFNQTDLVWVTKFGAMTHKILSGVELGRQHSVNHRNTGYFAVGPNTNATGTTYNAPISAPTIHEPVDFRSNGTTDADNNGVATVAALYVQDQVEVTPQFQAVAGLRYDYFRVNFNDTRPAPTGVGNITTHDGLVSPRVGLIYKPVEAVSAYTSYSVTYLPRSGEQLSSLSSFNKALDPETYRNIEIGLKWDLRSDLALTVAAYKQDRKNVAVTDTTPGAPAGQLMLVDGQRVTGLELGISGNITRKWSVAGGYAYQIGEILSNQSATVQKGASLGQVPTDTFSLWNRYDFTPRWGAGLGVINRSDMFATTENVATPSSNVTLAGYTRFDGAAFFTLNRNFSAQVNVENLFDKRYYANADNNNNISPGGPRAVRVGLTARF